MQNVTENPPALSDRQLRAVPYLSAALIFTDAAENLGVSRETMSLWFKDPDIRDVYEQQWDEAAEISTDEIRVLMLKSFIALAERLVSDGPRRPAPAFRYVTVSDLETADDEREREARKRLMQLVSDVKNDSNGSGPARQSTVSRPRKHRSVIPAYPVHHTRNRKPRFDT